MENTPLTVAAIFHRLARFAGARRWLDLASLFYHGSLPRSERAYFGRPISEVRYWTAISAWNERRALLEQLLLQAEWGSQDHGRVFVTQRSNWPSEHDVTSVTIHVDGLPRLSGDVRWNQQTSQPEVWDMKVHDLEEERQRREAQRANRRALQARHAALRLRIAAQLQRGQVPRDVVAVDGQRGGYLVVGRRVRVTQVDPWCQRTEVVEPGDELAIRGVLKAAGIEPMDHPFTTWCETVEDLTSIERVARVRPRPLPARLRHLRAGEARA